MLGLCGKCRSELILRLLEMVVERGLGLEREGWLVSYIRHGICMRRALI